MNKSQKFLAALDAQLSDERKIEFAQFIQKYYPKDYVYYEARGAFLNNNEMEGLFDFVRGVGNFVSGLFGDGVQGAYQQFVNWEQTGATPSNAQQQQLTQQDIYNIQKIAVDEALQEQERQNQSKMMPIYIGLALLAFMVIKK